MSLSLPSGPALSLHIHHSSHLLPLTASLADLLGDPLPDPFMTEVVAVPTAGVRDWLEQQLSRRLGATDCHDGISANIDMMFPGRFNAAALGRDPDSDDPWAIERLTWFVLAELDHADLGAAGVAALRSRYATARRIADLFDSYSNNRPQLLQQWQAGHDGDGTVDEHEAVVPLPDDQRWQPQLWRRVRAAIGLPSRGEAMQSLLDGVRSGQIEPRLPPRVALFGVSAASANQLAILDALGTVRDVHLHLVHPSPVAWTAGRRLTRLEPRHAFDAASTVRLGLLKSWARPAMETTALINGLAVDVESLPGPNADGAAPLNRLRSLQADIAHDSATASGGRAHPNPPGVHPDRSLQVHGCHGATRQLEVLRDALGHLFVTDPTLAAHDIVVVCPDLRRFAPLAAAVFGRGLLPLPVRVSDLSLGHANPIATAMAEILDVLAGRCTVVDILSLCALDPVRRMMGFAADDAETVERWTARLGTRWGLDTAQRDEWLSTRIGDSTWQTLLDSVLVGAAMPAPTPRSVGRGVVPHDDMAADHVAIAGRLAELLTRLRRLRNLVTSEHTLNDWVAILIDLVDSLCAADPNEAWQVTEIVSHLQALTDRAPDDRSNRAMLAPADVRAIVGELMDDSHGRLMVRSGAITITAMVPVRNVPARVVCVLGLDESALRANGADGDDILSSRPCVGERDPRSEGRHLLLDAVMAAGDHFLVTYDGADITTNRELPMPVQLAELLDAVGGPAGVVFHHPRQAYDERNFGVGGTEAEHSPRSFAPGQAFSFDGGMRIAAQARRRAGGVVAPPPLLPAMCPPTVSVEQLVDACVRPARTYLRGRIDASVPRRIEESDPNIPIDATPLDLSALGTELLVHRSTGTEQDVEAWWAAKRMGGTLPPRALADGVLTGVTREVDLLLGARPDLAARMHAGGAEQIELPLPVPDDPAFTTVLAATITPLDGHTLVRAAFTRPHARDVVRAAIELAALVTFDPSREWEALLVNRPSSNTSIKPTVRHLRPVTGPTRAALARHVLHVAVDLCARALREPLPLFEITSPSLFASGELDEEEWDHDLRDDANAMLWQAYAPDEILAIPIRARDELRALRERATDQDSDGGGRALALARYWWGACFAFITEDAPAAGPEPL
ncbi:MAG TPA: exodeoxyribonuclease V subunit gamma [Ilumatobacteraceae bacterium]